MAAEKKVLHANANRLMIGNFKQDSPDNDTPEQRLIRLTVEHPQYSLDYSFLSYSEDWFVSDVGIKMSLMMQSTQMVAVDCEMVLCSDGTEGVVRVGAVDRNLKVILDEFVKPHKPVVDYRTTITGVTSDDIKKATLSRADIQEKFRPFLSNGAILVGHSLSHDLEVLKIDHPKVIDTSLVFKYPDANARKLRRPSLNNLCKFMLGYEVQKAGVSHNCVHDASAAMKLALAVIEKRVDTTITKEMIEDEKSRLFLHRIPQSVSSEKLEQVLSRNFLSKKFTVDIKQKNREDTIVQLLFSIAQKMQIKHLKALLDTKRRIDRGCHRNSFLGLHRIPPNVSSEVLARLLSVEFFTKEFTIDVKPAKRPGGYYCAVVIFESPKKADQAFENVVGNQQEDSSGLPQKRIVFRLSSCPSASLCIRKMV